MDINGNGVIDVRQTWEAGLPVIIEFDADENGRYEYAMTNTADNEASYWDFDEDGRIDHEESVPILVEKEAFPASFGEILGYFGERAQ